MEQPVALINTKYGWMMCPPGDQYVTGSLREWGVYSEAEVETLRELARGKRVVVVGGHIGALAIPVAEYAESLTVYEPQPLLAKLLAANAGMSAWGHKILVRNRAVGPAGTIKVPVLRLDCNYNMGRLGCDDWGNGVEIPMEPLQQSMDLLVVDAEGMEQQILELIPEWPPIMWVENDRPDKSDALVATIRARGYNCYWVIQTLAPIGVNPAIGPFPMQASFNMLCTKDVIDGLHPVEKGLEGCPGDWLVLDRIIL